MATKEFNETRIQRQPLFRALGLNFFYPPVDPGPLDFHSQILPVNVFPAKPKQLTCSKAEAHIYDGHRAHMIVEMLPEPLEFFNRQSPWFFCTLCESLDLQKTHGISVALHQLPPHCPLKKNVHHTADVPLAFRC